MARPDMAPTETRSSNKLTQLMSAGLPVIAGPLPAYVDIITPEVDGFIAQTEEDWLRAFAQLRDPAERERIGRAARARVEQAYSLEEQVRKLEAVFSAVLNGAAPKSDELAEESRGAPGAGRSTPGRSVD